MIILVPIIMFPGGNFKVLKNRWIKNWVSLKELLC